MSSFRLMVSGQQERDGQGARMPEQHTAKDRRQHLYFAFDDWNYGYTIRKVKAKAQVKALSSGEGEGSGEGAKLKVITRVCAPRGLADYFTVAFGAKILVLHPGAVDVTDGIPIIDVKDRSFTFGPMPNYPSCPIYFPVGDDKLFALDIGTFDYILRTPERGKPWVWHRLSYPPFERIDVSSFAVQPDGCILVSTKSDTTGAMATFIFDTEEHVWKPYGDWVFLFTGRGLYDPSLDAFVGLSKCPEKLGYLCSCTRAGTGTGDNSRSHRSLDWKYSQETVYSNNPTERHVSATLVPMHQGNFCLVECVSIDGVVDQELRKSGIDQKLREPVSYVWQPGVVDPVWQDLWNRQVEFLEPQVDISQIGKRGRVPHCGRFMYRVKTFSLRYDDRNGDLKLENCQVHCYSLPHEASVEFLKQDPVAFWL